MEPLKLGGSMGEFSITHLLLLSIIFLIFFGPSRLPQLGQSLGKAIRGFKQGLNEIDAEVKDVSQEQRNVGPQQQPNYQQTLPPHQQQPNYNQTQAPQQDSAAMPGVDSQKKNT